MAKAKDNGPKAVEGYNMLIWENADGSAFYTGSFNRNEWDRYLDESGNKAAETAGVPDPDAANGDTTPDEVVDPDEETVESLKDKLRERDLPVSGTKAELVERLNEAEGGES